MRNTTVMVKSMDFLIKVHQGLNPTFFPFINYVITMDKITLLLNLPFLMYRRIMIISTYVRFKWDKTDKTVSSVPSAW